MLPAIPVSLALGGRMRTMTLMLLSFGGGALVALFAEGESIRSVLE